MLNESVSRDKAIVQLNHLLSDWDDDWNIAIRKCIETIKILPSVTPQPCEDCVSRRAVYEILNDAYFLKLDDGAALQESVKQLPPVTPQPKMGHWVKVIEENGHAFYLCSVCKEGTDENYDWCPFCGCKMQEVKDE
jgi:hypothetical protein